MPTYVLLATLSPQGAYNLSLAPERLIEVNREVEALGGRVLRQWGLIGPFDFLSILEAPDSEAVSRISAELSARGSAHIEAYTAIPVEELMTGTEFLPDRE